MARLLGWLSTCVELPLSRRGLPLCFLATAAIFTLVGWVRPELSHDLRSFHLSLGLVRSGDTNTPIQLHGKRSIPPDSVGVLLWGVIAVGAVVVVLRPERSGVVAGVLLCAATAGHFAVMLNPNLMEALDLEYEQRQRAVAVLGVTQTTMLSGGSTDRLGPLAAPGGDDERAGMVRGWFYLYHGRYLVPWALLGVLLGCGGTLTRRLLLGLGWSLLAVAVGMALYLPQLCAEVMWQRARYLQGKGDNAAAALACAEALAWSPAMAHQQRTWMLRGKIDYQLGRGTPAGEFFRAYQFGRTKESPRDRNRLVDITWPIKRGSDPVPPVPPGGPIPGTAPMGAPSLERRYALALMEKAAPLGVGLSPALTGQLARLRTEEGIEDFIHVAAENNTLVVYSQKQAMMATARLHWLRAQEAAPQQLDLPLYLGLSQALMERYRPDDAAREMEPLLGGLADRALDADIQAVLGDAYFEAGRMNPARLRYAQSFERYSLPDNINYHAQQRLGGF
jgi:hypothetical protein